MFKCAVLCGAHSSQDLAGTRMVCTLIVKKLQFLQQLHLHLQQLHLHLQQQQQLHLQQQQQLHLQQQQQLHLQQQQQLQLQRKPRS
ncbi:hypothetical protein FHG87_016047 [Trinorchestia longiramus]|nr:hypothetical protein FHG87_016047 [Trinorchestia longiramus]